MVKSFGKSASVIFAGLSAALVMAGVGTWQIADPVNTAYNVTAPLITKKESDRNLIDKSQGDTLVGLGIFFGILSVVAIFFSKKSQ